MSRGHRRWLRVLVVEDDFLVSREVVRCLREVGYHQISEVSDGEAALRFVEAEHPDVVVMDLEMPVMGGMEATRSICERHPTPVVIMTAYPSDVEAAAQAGASAYLTKPPEPLTLDRAITLALARHVELLAVRSEVEALKQQLESRSSQGLIPMCARCKSIRDDQGRWEHIAVWLRKHTGSEVTHGICPTCAREVYPEIFDER